MSYTINLTNGNLFAIIPDDTINTSSSMTLVGRNYAGYGQFINDDIIHLLECGANGVPPTAPLVGQLWFNTATGVLQVYNGAAFKPIGGAAASTTAPTNNTMGDLWYDSVNAQLNVWTGTQWLLIGPIYSGNAGLTGALPATIVDNLGASHSVIELYVGASVVGIISKDAEFQLLTPITGFTTIKPGITLSSVVGTQVPLFQGTATNSQRLNSLISSQLMRADESTATSGSLAVGTTSGNLTVGPNADFVVSVNTNDVTLQNADINGNIRFAINPANVSTVAMTLNGGTGSLSVLGNVTGNYFIGNGSMLTGIVIPASYTNANVATYLPTYSGNLNSVQNILASGNIIATSVIGVTVASTGSMSSTGNVTGSYIIGNGSRLTNLPAANVVGTVATADHITNSTYNGYGVRTVSTENPSGGSNGDIWYKV